MSRRTRYGTLIRRETEELARLAGFRSRLDDQIAAQVATCRQAGASWATIATALGISRQATQKRYDRRLPL